MKAYWVKSPRWLSFIFKKRIWHFSPTEKTIYLTFDDGPTPVSNFVLNQLENYHAKATFFCIGANIDKHPKIFDTLIKKGHSIGNHTQHHLNGWNTSTSAYINEIDLAEKRIGKNTLKSKIFRPPYGKCTKAQRKLIYDKGYKIIMWSVLSADFDASISKEKCLTNVLKNTKNGSIVVFHDSEKAKEKLQFVLPKVLKHFSRQGYQFKGIDSLTL